jgi:hypothetical protein
VSIVDSVEKLKKFPKDKRDGLTNVSSANRGNG